MAPRISVICIFLDEEAFLDEAIRSVFAQDCDDWELILVDDGSTDASSAIAGRWAGEHPQRVRYVTHPGHANRGMSASRNAGIALARGDYIAFIDGDDRWRPHKLREQAAILDAAPDVYVVRGVLNYWRSWCGGRDEPFARGLPRDRVLVPPETALRLYPLGTAPAVATGEAMFRRTLFDIVGQFHEQFTGLYEDQAFFAKACLTVPIYVSSHVWLDYRQHPESCVSLAHSEGAHPRLRRDFLHWLAGWIADRPANARVAGEQAVLAAIRRELWKLDHPLCGKVMTRLQQLAGR